jgi:hypothetical protein
MEWKGFTPITFLIEHPALERSSHVCKICKVSPSCVAAYSAKIYYVFGKDNMTHAYMHLGLHKHLGKAGENQVFKERTHTHWEAGCKDFKGHKFAIVMEATKELIEGLLLHPEGAPGRTFNLEELVPILDKCKYMSLPNILNIGDHIQVLMEI